jgi:hypothetical protein
MSDCVQVAFLSNLVVDYFIRKMDTVHGAVTVDQITVLNKKNSVYAEPECSLFFDDNIEFLYRFWH